MPQTDYVVHGFWRLALRHAGECDHDAAGRTIQCQKSRRAKHLPGHDLVALPQHVVPQFLGGVVLYVRTNEGQATMDGVVWKVLRSLHHTESEMPVALHVWTQHEANHAGGEDHLKKKFVSYKRRVFLRGRYIRDGL